MKKEREPRTPRLPTFAEAEEAQILADMSNWPHRMDERLKSAGFGILSEAGHKAWQDYFEQELANPRPDSVPTISWLAEHGHISAQEALNNHLTRCWEDTKFDLNSLPSSLRTYSTRVFKKLVPPHPKDRSDTIRNMIRDRAIPIMVDKAEARWKLPRYYSSNGRHSAAWFVAVTMTNYGDKLGEQQVRRICKLAPKLPERLEKFLGGAEPAF